MSASLPHENAVSPVIGTILLVALTVIFISIVLAVATGMTDGMFTFKSVGLSLEPYGVRGDAPEHGIGITILGGTDAANLVSLSAVMTGPDLIYAPTAANYVNNPCVGTEYKMAAYVDPEVITAIKTKQDYNVNLTTDGKVQVGAQDCYVTVTGKFRDGTEQVLLVQHVIIPAIPGEEGGVTNEYISVTPYTITDVYPGHGFIITIHNDSITNVEATFKDNIRGIVTVNRDDKGLVNKQVTYDISTRASGGDWHLTPYPDLNTFWALGELTGNVTATLTWESGTYGPTTIEVGPITIPPRVNIFEDTASLSGTITYTGGKLSYTPVKTGKSPHTGDLNFAYFYTGSGDPEKISITEISGWSDNTKNYTIAENDLHTGKNIEAYVRSSVGGTEVWYLLGRASVRALLSS